METVVNALGRIKLMTPVISFVGHSGSGKTTLLEQVTKELKLRGLRVATVKHAPHGFDIDRSRKDSWRLTEAGADMVAISSPRRLALFQSHESELTVAEIEALFAERVDLVLAEGYKNSNLAKIVVLDSKEDWERFCGVDHVLTTVTGLRTLSGAVRFDSDDINRVVNLLMSRTGVTLPVPTAGVQGSVRSFPAGNQASQFEELLAQSAAHHGHICPGQVLGVRMAICGLREIGIADPKQEPKRLLTYVEIDRCASDAIQVVTGCKLGKRTLKYIDYGKLAATFVDLHTGDAVRVAAREEARDKTSLYHRPGWTKHEAEVAAYRIMPDEDLFCIEKVLVQIPAGDMPGPPQRRVICDRCGEGVNDGRDVMIGGKVLCRACAQGSYYEPLS